ncbi:MAG: TIGR03546 family protein, partial [Candidatus Bipolaricaulia bacterium]
MYPLKLIRKIFKILQSELSPAQVGAGFSLGIFMGLAPLGLHSFLLLSLALLLRLSFSSFLISFGLFKLLYLPLREVSYLIGQALLEWPPLDPLWGAVLHWPIIAPLGFERYLLFGSYILSLLLAIPAFLLVRFLVLRYRRSFLARVEGSAAYRRLKKRRWFKFLQWLIAGGEAKFLAPKRRGLFRYLRREMLVALPLLYLAAYLIAGAIVPFLTDTIITRAGTVLVGSRVTVERSRFNLFTGRLTVQGLEVRDPKKRSEDVMAVSELMIDVGILPLLSRRVLFNEGAIRELSFNVRRETDGSLNLDNFHKGWDFEPYLEWLQRNAG